LFVDKDRLEEDCVLRLLRFRHFGGHGRAVAKYACGYECMSCGGLRPAQECSTREPAPSSTGLP
jgi:hypothetical protein